MPQRPPAQLVAPVAPAEVLSEMNLGYNGYTDPALANPKMWTPGTVNVYSGAFGYVQRSRFANVAFPAVATRIQTTGGSSILKYYIDFGLSNPSVTYTVSVWVKNQGAGVISVDNNMSGSQSLSPGQTIFVTMTQVGNGTSDIHLGFLTAGVGDSLDVIAANPSVAANNGPNLITQGASGPANFIFGGGPQGGLWTSAFGGNTVTLTQGLQLPGSTTGFTIPSLKYFSLPGLSSYLLADGTASVGGSNLGKMFSYDTGLNYASVQRLNPYVDPAGVGSQALTGPWSREVLQNIVYEMNGQVKQAGRGGNAAIIEGFGIDAPDASPQVTINGGASQAITGISRSNGVVTATIANPLTVPGGNGIGFINVSGVTDTSYNGTFIVQTGNGGTTLTWNQFGQNNSSSGGAVDINITKTVGRSYAWAWENANKGQPVAAGGHVSAPSPSTQFILYNAQNGVISLAEPGTASASGGSPTVTGTQTFFTSAWVGRSLWIAGAGSVGRIASVQSPTTLTLASGASASGSGQFQVYDPQSTHVRLYQTADGQATYFRTQRNAFVSSATSLAAAGLQFVDNGNSEPPNFPYTTETSQINSVPPPIGQFINEYQGRLCVFGIAGAPQSFFYSNQETTTIGMPQESFAPLNQITLPIANGKINGMLEFPGSLIIWSDKQDMFRLSGLLTDNTLQTAASQGASISRLPYNLGCAGPYACDITPLGGIWLTANGEVWLFTDRYAPRNIGRPVQDILSSIGVGSLPLARAKYYHTGTRNWWVLAVAANGATFNNTLLVLDLDLLAANGSPSYFTFDMATNHPAWWVIQPGPVMAQGQNAVINPRCDAIEAVFEVGGAVRLLAGSSDLIQDADYQTGAFGTETQVPGASLALHAYGNDTAHSIKRPSFVRFNTNQNPLLLGVQGWSFQAQGVDDDFYTFTSPLTLNFSPGINDSATLSGNPSLAGGEPFRHSPALYRIGGVNFVAGRRIKFQVNFPPITGVPLQLSSIQLGFGARPPG
jgi:hypothetical protein